MPLRRPRLRRLRRQRRRQQRPPRQRRSLRTPTKSSGLPSLVSRSASSFSRRSSCAGAATALSRVVSRVHTTIGPLHVVTPTFSDAALDGALGREVWLKMECLQPTGSFKIRGIGRLCQELAAAGSSRFVSSSGGNAGYAVAYAGRALSLPVEVIVPSTTPIATRRKLEELGALVRVVGDVWDEADIEARRLGQLGAAYVPPFDHPSLWQGHATMIDEVAESHGKPDLVI